MKLGSLQQHVIGDSGLSQTDINQQRHGTCEIAPQSRSEMQSLNRHKMVVAQARQGSQHGAVPERIG